MAAVAWFRCPDSFPENVRGHGVALTILLRYRSAQLQCSRGNLRFALAPSPQPGKEQYGHSKPMPWPKSMVTGG